MNDGRSAHRVAWFVVALCAALGCVQAATMRAESACNVPYRPGQDYIGRRGARGLMQVSMVPRDVTIANLRCVATQLRQRHPEWRDIVVLIFDWKAAARSYMVGWDMADVESSRPRPPYEHYARHMRAMYVIDDQPRDEYLQLSPMGNVDGPADIETKIALAGDVPPHCGWEIARRCVMAAAYPAYPWIERVPPGGDVVMRATAGPDGGIRDVVIVRTTVSPDSAQPLLARHAREHLKTVRLDSAPTSSTFEVTYRYDPAPAADGPTSIAIGPDGGLAIHPLITP